MFFMEEAFRKKLHSLRGEYDRSRPTLDLIARVVDGEVKRIARYIEKPAISESRIKTLDSMRLKYVDIYERMNGELGEAREGGNAPQMRSIEAEIERFLDNPLCLIHDVVGLRYITSYNYEVFADRVRARFESFESDDHEADRKLVEYNPPSLGIRSDRLKAQHLLGRLTSNQVLLALEQAKRENIEVSAPLLAAMPFEIQLRTTVTHAWTVISHEKLYKVSGREKVAERMSGLIRDVLALQAAFDSIMADEDLWLDNLMQDLGRTKTQGGPYRFKDAGLKAKLMAMSCRDSEALTAYAMYKFYDHSVFGPTNEVSPLWIDLCARNLGMTDCQSIADLEPYVNSVIDEVLSYKKEVHDKHKNIFKDATDWLSKCLIFSLEHFRLHYPYGDQTRDELKRLGKLP